MPSQPCITYWACSICVHMLTRPCCKGNRIRTYTSEPEIWLTQIENCLSCTEMDIEFCLWYAHWCKFIFNFLRINFIPGNSISSRVDAMCFVYAALFLWSKLRMCAWIKYVSTLLVYCFPTVGFTTDDNEHEFFTWDYGL